MVHVFLIGWRKISCYFNISYEIRDKNIEFDGDRNVQRAEFVIRAHMQYVSRLLTFHRNDLYSHHNNLNFPLILFATPEVEGSQMDGALVIDVKRDFRNQIMMFQAQRRLGPKIKLVKYVILSYFAFFNFIINKK